MKKTYGLKTNVEIDDKLFLLRNYFGIFKGSDKNGVIKTVFAEKTKRDVEIEERVTPVTLFLVSSLAIILYGATQSF